LYVLAPDIAGRPDQGAGAASPSSRRKKWLSAYGQTFLFRLFCSFLVTDRAPRLACAAELAAHPNLGGIACAGRSLMVKDVKLTETIGASIQDL
jgi:hypothetical protein